MSIPDQPRLRRIESFPVRQANGEMVFALRDPEGFSGTILLPYPAAALASLMDGSRTISDLQEDFARQFKQPVNPGDVVDLVHQLDARLYLDTQRFRAHWKTEIERYLNSPVRPAAHAGAAYAAEPEALRKQISELFTHPNGPGGPPLVADRAAEDRLRGILSPHIDLRRGGPTFAWAYKTLIEESDADVFVILGTAHSPMRNLYSLTRKSFATPLGAVETDRHFVSKLTKKFSTFPGGKDRNLFGDELAHRQEHSIEFQTVFLQYLLGPVRPFKIVPVLVGSFHPFLDSRTAPSESSEVSAFVQALRATVAAHGARVCTISSGDLAHIGQRFGDRAALDTPRLHAQAEDDRALLDAACRADSAALFDHVARRQDRHRICGLSPTYTLLEATQPKRGELLRYDQAVELDGTSCVTFASAAFYGE